MDPNKVNLEDVLRDRFSEEDLLEVPLSGRVFRGFLFIAAALTLIALLRLGAVGVLNQKFYKNRALANMSHANIEEAPRGTIYDRFGRELAANEPALRAVLLPHEITGKTDERLSALKRTSAILGVSVPELQAKIREKDWDFSEKLIVKENLSHEEVAAIESSSVPGLKVEKTFRRVHSSPHAFSHLVGFVGLVHENDLKQNPALFIDDEIGKAGLEVRYDRRLRGVNGREVLLKDALGNVKDKDAVSLAKGGLNLETFIDAEFQEYFYGRLQAALTNLGRDIGVGIALNPKNGEVLALFNIPSPDVSEVAASLNKENNPFFNRAVSGLYTPGSTIKPLHAVAALSEGVVRPEDEIYSAGFIEVPNPYDPARPSRFLDWRAHGWVNLYGALARSSNVYFYEVGGGFQGQPGLGIGRLRDWWQKFFLNIPTGIDLPGEASGFLPSVAWKEKETKEPWRIGDTYNVSIGQGDLLTTPIGLLNYISAVANGGRFYRPRIMKAVFGEDGGIIETSEPWLLGKLEGAAVANIDEVSRGLRDAVSKPYGTASMLSSLPLPVAAKTGTSQVALNEKLNAFFVGYAPYDDPEIAVLILVEDAKEGSLNTVPIAYDVFLWYYENRLKNN